MPHYCKAPVILTPVDVKIATDTSFLGWGATMGHARIAGLWEWEKLWSHINKKELQTCFTALEYFVPHLRDIHVQLSVDNTAVVSYLNHAGGTRQGPKLCQIWQLEFGNSVYRERFIFQQFIYHVKNPRWYVSSEARKHGMDARFECFSSGTSCLSAVSSGPVCFSPKPSTSKLFFLDRRPTGYGNNMLQHSMEVQTVLPVSSISSHTEMYSKGKTGSDRCITHNTSLEISTMVPSFTRNADRPTSSITSSPQIVSSSNVPISSSPINGKEINLAVWSVLGNPLNSEGFLKGCPKYCFPHGDPVQRNITSQHGNQLIAGVLKNRKIQFLAL